MRASSVVMEQRSSGRLKKGSRWVDSQGSKDDNIDSIGHGETHISTSNLVCNRLVFTPKLGLDSTNSSSEEFVASNSAKHRTKRMPDKISRTRQIETESVPKPTKPIRARKSKRTSGGTKNKCNDNEQSILKPGEHLNNPLSADVDWSTIPNSQNQNSTNSTAENEKLHKNMPSPGSDSSSSSGVSEWEDIHNDKVKIKEEDFFKDLLNKASNNHHNIEVDNAEETMSIFMTRIPKKGEKDHVKEAIRVMVNIFKEQHAFQHLLHTLCLITFSRFMNMVCDSTLIRAVAMSLISGVPFHENPSQGGMIEESALPLHWGVNNLTLLVRHILTNVGILTEKNTSSEDKSLQKSILERLSRRECTWSDASVLMTAALRAIGLDVRLIICFNPLAVKPSPAQLRNVIASLTKKFNNQTFNYGAGSAADESEKPTSSFSNDQVISSSDDEGELRGHTITTKLHVFCEVFSSKEGRWLCVDPMATSSPVDEAAVESQLPYAVALCSSREMASPSQHSSTKPHVGRSPIDLASRYDPGWCVASKEKRLSQDKWSKTLTHLSHILDLDAANHGSLTAKNNNSLLVKRDAADHEAIRADLLKLPLPKRMQDFKNHPLYVLERHLLKYEVVHPPSCLTLGVFQGKPVYSRDCVQLCHTRESWLKEAKIIRPGERPAKVVKARLSMKRRLLQADDAPPPTVDVYGVWQTQAYVPPVAVGGKVPRNEHGNVELFKPCMLPLGCVHVRLPGVHHLAKKLSIDMAPAMVGWTFHGAGWCHPEMDGYVVCQEYVPILVDAWREQANTAARRRGLRALDSWRRLVRAAFIWRQVQAKFNLGPRRICPPSNGVIAAHDVGVERLEEGAAGPQEKPDSGGLPRGEVGAGASVSDAFGPEADALPASEFPRLAGHAWQCLDSVMPVADLAELAVFPTRARGAAGSKRTAGLPPTQGEPVARSRTDGVKVGRSSRRRRSPEPTAPADDYDDFVQ